MNIQFKWYNNRKYQKELLQWSCRQTGTWTFLRMQTFIFPVQTVTCLKNWARLFLKMKSTVSVQCQTSIKPTVSFNTQSKNTIVRSLTKHLKRYQAVVPLPENIDIEESKEEPTAAREYIQLVVEHPLLRAYEDHVQDLIRENWELRKMLTAASETNKQIWTEIAKAEGKVNKLALQINDEIVGGGIFASEGKESKATKQSIMETYRNEHSVLLKEIAETKEKINRLEADNLEKTKLVGEYENSLKEDNYKIKKLQTSLEEVTNERKLLETKLLLKADENKAIQEERITFTNIQSRLENEIKTLKSELENAKNIQLQTESTLSKRIRELEKTLKTTKSEKRTLETKVKSFDQTEETLKEKNKRLSEEISQAKQDFAQIVKLLEESEVKTQELEAELADSKEKQREHKRKMEDYAKKLDSATFNETQYQKQVAILEQKLQRATKDAESEYNSALLKTEIKHKTEAGENARKYSQLLDEFKDLKRSYDELQGKYESTSKAKEAAEQRMVEECAISKRKIQALEESLQSVKRDAESEKAGSEKELFTVKMGLNEQLRDSELKRKEADLQLNYLKAQLEELKKQYKNLEAEREQKVSEIEKLTAELKLQDKEHQEKLEEVNSKHYKTMTDLQRETEYSKSKSASGDEKVRFLLKQQEALCEKWRKDYYTMNNYYEKQIKELTRKLDGHNNQNFAKVQKVYQFNEQYSCNHILRIIRTLHQAINELVLRMLQIVHRFVTAFCQIIV
eukprot:TRINITY_DN105550_c0_g1_i1.p1 TRINITY_DN105550_c0_g1~~TRINITY_DN105550_c0_g1_i1.p1  ORF type:complete len:741 (+),score=110.18 TRINITY_DN105550_c0_g1_i1:1102-3324(+)